MGCKCRWSADSLAIAPPPERFGARRNSGIIKGRCAERQLPGKIPNYFSISSNLLSAAAKAAAPQVILEFRFDSAEHPPNGILGHVHMLCDVGK